MQRVVLGFADYREAGERLAAALGVDYAEVAVHRFPDGESRVTVPQTHAREVIVCRSLNQPNHKLVELQLLAITLREQGTPQLTLVTPYLCYMRQDIAFHPGEVVSQRVIGQLLASLFDRLVTVDAHLHRIDNLVTVMPGCDALNLSVAPLMAELLRRRGGRPLLVGPDEESAQWVGAIAAQAGLAYIVASKHRLGDRNVTLELPAGHYQGREMVLVDDMVTTGNTLIAVATQLRAAGAGPIHAMVSHALCGEADRQRLTDAGIESLWSSDSVPHPSNRFNLAPLLAAVLR